MGANAFAALQRDVATLWINASAHFITPDLIRNCPKAAFPLRDVLFPAASEGRLTGEMHLGYWSDVGTPERLAAAQADYESGLCR